MRKQDREINLFVRCSHSVPSALNALNPTPNIFKYLNMVAQINNYTSNWFWISMSPSATRKFGWNAMGRLEANNFVLRTKSWIFKFDLYLSNKLLR